MLWMNLKKSSAKGEKPVKKDRLLYYSTHMKDPKKARHCRSGRLGNNRQWVVFRGDENILKFDNGNLLSSTKTHTAS